MCSVSNVSELEERLSGMERALYHLVDKLEDSKPKNRSSMGSYRRPRPISGSSSSDGTDSTDSSTTRQLKNSNTVQRSSYDHLALSPRGCSLVSLCEQLRDVVSETCIEHNANNVLPAGGKLSVDACVCQLFDRFNSLRNLEIFNDGSLVDLPPRSLLAMACIPFLQSKDLATDLFDQEVFRQNVERIYGSPYRSEDAAWAICFNLIILLGFGVDQSSRASGDFLKPFLLNATRAYFSMGLMLTPKLIDVQALSLLVSDHFLP